MSEQNSTQDISDNNEYILEVTQEEYDEMKTSGIDEEAIPSVGKHIFRRRTRKINPRDAKVKTTVFIDGDILQHFRRRAEQPNAVLLSLNQPLRLATYPCFAMLHSAFEFWINS